MLKNQGTPKGSFLSFLSPMVFCVSIVFTCPLWFLSLWAYAVEPMVAFPGAEGFGRYAKGGRGGRVIEVTSLNDSGSGSLRACVEASGPRTCVFRIGGTITLGSQLRVSNPFLTIAGQTAPGDGIVLRNGASNQTPIYIRTNDVVIRYLRIRPGPGGAVDAIGMGDGAKHVIIDHVSGTWSNDETMSATASTLNSSLHEVTFQWNLIAEPLNCSTHPEGCHGYGTTLKRVYNVSVHHQLYAHTAARAPQLNPASAGVIDIVNNVIYNAKSQGSSWGASHIKNEFGVPLVNYVNNFVKKGANTNHSYYVSADGGQIYMTGNIVPGPSVMRPGDEKLLVKTLHSAPAITTVSASQAFPDVLATVGDSMGLRCDGTTFFRRDSVDTRIVNDVRNGTGRIINHPSEVGGWPTLASGTPCPDADHDGMPDVWELARGFNPNDASDGPRVSANGYTNLENYLNGSAGGPIIGPDPPAPPQRLTIR